MRPEFEPLTLQNNVATGRFELEVEGSTAYLEYRQEGDRVFLIHTEVPASLGGKGVGAALVEKTFAYLELRGLKMAPYCPFVLSYLKRHPVWKRITDQPEGR